MKKITLSFFFFISLTTFSFAQIWKPLLSVTVATPIGYTGVISVALVPLAVGAPAVVLAVSGYASVAGGIALISVALSKLTQGTIAQGRGVAEKESLKDELPSLIQDFESGKVHLISDLKQSTWRSYLQDIKQDEQLKAMILSETSGDGTEDMKLIVASIIDLLY